MTPVTPDTLLHAFLIFCRVGACLMLMPGFSSPRVPVRLRLFIAAGATLALSPFVLPAFASFVEPNPAALLSIVVSETMTGAMIGLMARMFFLALQFIGTAMATATGLGQLPGMPIDEAEASTPFVTLITLTATTLMFVTNQHAEVIRALAGSYSRIAPGTTLDAQGGLIQIADRASETFYLALRIGSPFMVYAVVVNLAIGLMNKLTPQIPVYFISLPFVIAGGLFLLYFSGPEALRLFITAFSAWLLNG
ncbi:flagellar biosynthetic protein FliR [Bosea sp. Root381]|uniref:flagellar biosynthesis protein FliR n=1 Tax=Bosea sp. Root381 TaxID=1736524 RepID=UPI0006FDCA30|nr:flagellar biosynthesis protein FliR [Bosea sp. Root381]KRE15744.1 flagellar biosynthetic protein FliR [Bosea sp. Root381]